MKDLKKKGKTLHKQRKCNEIQLFTSQSETESIDNKETREIHERYLFKENYKIIRFYI